VTFEHTSENLYVIYYGWLIASRSGRPNAQAKAIARARPKILIACYHTFTPQWINLSSDVQHLLRSAGIRTFAYTTTSYGTRRVQAIQQQIRQYILGGVDGIFLDEAYNFLDASKEAYYRRLYEYTKELGADVILNPGISDCGEAIMRVTDMLMVEHQWQHFYQANPWRHAYPPARFMGTSSNEPGAIGYVGHAVDATQALRDTREAWANGVGWHYSTDRYITLPPWFLDYARTVRSP